MSQGSKSVKSSLDSLIRPYWIPIAGVILYLILDAIAQSLPPHYSPIRQAESDLAVGPYGYIMTINFLNRGILSLVFLYTFMRTVEQTGGQRSKFRTGHYLLFIWAAGAILLAIFPTDVPATPMSWHGAIHFVVAIIAFIGGAFGTLSLSMHFGESGATRGAKTLAKVLSGIAVLSWAIEFGLPFVLPHFANKIAGLTERLFLGSVLLWIFAISLYMVTRRSVIENVAQDVKKTP